MANNPKKNPAVLTKKHQDRMHREQRQTRLIVIGTLIVLGLVLLVVGYGIMEQQVLRYRRPVAVINNERVSAEDFRSYTKYYRYNIIRNAEQTYQFASMFGSDPAMLQNFASQLQSAQASLSPYTAAETSLNSMVDNAIVMQEAKKQGITITDEEIEIRLQEFLGYFANGTPTPTQTLEPAATSTLSAVQLSMLQPTATQVPEATAAPMETQTAQTPSAEETQVPSTETVEATPAGPTPTSAPSTPTPSPTPYTLEGYQQLYSTVVADYRDNYEIPEDTLKYVVAVDLFRQKLRDKVIGEVPCEEEQVWAQHILVPDEALATSIKGKLDAGEDWYKLAAEYSTDEGSKATGGDLGWFNISQMVPEFGEAAFAMEVGETSEPVLSQFGYHIIRVLGHENRALSGAECDNLANSKFDEWIAAARANSAVELLPHWETIYPLQPTLPAEIQQVIDSLNAQNAQQQVPVEVPTP